MIYLHGRAVVEYIRGEGTPHQGKPLFLCVGEYHGKLTAQKKINTLGYGISANAVKYQ